MLDVLWKICTNNSKFVLWFDNHLMLEFNFLLSENVHGS